MRKTVSSTTFTTVVLELELELLELDSLELDSLLELDSELLLLELDSLELLELELDVPEINCSTLTKTEATAALLMVSILICTRELEVPEELDPTLISLVVAYEPVIVLYCSCRALFAVVKLDFCVVMLVL